MATSTSILKHLLVLSVIALAIAGIYGRVSLTYFCADDDFIEAHLTAFGDINEPLTILTTSHFHSYKYRPLNRAITLLTYWAGNFNPKYFRLRNIIFHIVNMTFVYGLSYLLFKNAYISSMSAAFFGLSPVTNQVVNGAIWTTVIAHTEFLASLIIFMASLRAKRFSWQLLLVSLIVGWLGLLTYDSGIVVFVMMLSYLVLYFIAPQEQPVDWKFVVVFAVISTILIGCYLLLRSLFVPQGWEQSIQSVSGLSIIAKNIAMYIFALVSPIDPVLANAWLHTPFPSEIQLNSSTISVLLMLLCGSIMIAAFAIWRWTKSKINIIQTINWTTVLFLLLGVTLTLLPVLLLSSHPSETYLYLPMAFYALLLSCILAKLLYGSLAPRRRASVVAASIILLGLFCEATWIRNELIVQCGETARRILHSLPSEQLTSDAWRVSFANVTGEQSSRRYGLYGFRGVDTIAALAEERGNVAITSALQLVYKNELLTGEVVSAEELIAKCSSCLTPHQLCLRVHGDGRVEELCKYRGKR